ncbi:Na+-transporting methylmalonyl-CoA/oxaloacetate decarboxylase gamma subunit [Flavobacterium arsenatis]|uniref:Na+-transporting methylmalonyl-CoA/oxaloacetate decarboxylase gamma subunit n=1 Tax=Flavobacterium arsenatis TaxID=1484332 RepID=A0ABU1TRX3_9FLAO|nr:hypothetical protein [Flavobacterium arsenatis]MDR6968618.1 Na+-transporting methylmalonyl-CoA/oxaloacetate decarboxylase gamma subunit [Flavobacterium arsenatis]
MKNYILRISLMLMVLLTFTSCEVVEGIFNLGVGVGIFIVIAILAVIIWIISRFKK